MVAGRQWRALLVAAVAAGSLAGCGANSSPIGPTPSGTPATTAGPAPSPSTSPPPGPSSSPSSGPSPGPSPSPSTVSPAPSATISPSGLTLRELGFENGPLDEFSLPSDLAIATRVDQPNVVTIVLAGPDPAAVEDYLRAILPAEGFTIDARADAGQAMTFEGHGWTGGFTGSGATSAVVLRPA
jgi:hypothetical protein